jgi:uncharacterized protein GlcG (DUF336 family)
MNIELEAANKIIAAGLKLSRELNLQPMTFVVVDTGGAVVAAQRENESATLRFEIAYGKAYGAVGIGHSTRFMMDVMAPKNPSFMAALSVASNGRCFPVLGGVLIRDVATGKLLGALGTTGDVGANDEKVAIAAIEQCGYKADLS